MSDATPSLRPVGVVLAAGGLAGAIAGFATGAIDAVWSWGSASQFVPGLAGHLRFVVFAASAYACAGALIGLGVAATGLIVSRVRPRSASAPFAIAVAAVPCVAAVLLVAFKYATPLLVNRKAPGLVVVVAMAAGATALGVGLVIACVGGRLIELARLPAVLAKPLVSAIAAGSVVVIVVGIGIGAWPTAKLVSPLTLGALALSAAAVAGAASFARARSTASAIENAGLFASVLVGLPLLAVALAIVFVLRPLPPIDPKSIILSSMAAAIAGASFAIAATLIAARAMAPKLAPLIERVPALGSPLAVPGAALGLVAIGSLIWLATQWETAQLLPLRIPAVLGVGCVLALAAVRPGLALAIRLADKRIAIRAAVWIGGAIATGAIVLASGNSDGVIKAGGSYTAVAGTITRVVRPLFDWDRDGYARLLGGGDCDDGDRSVHPGALEIPDDGIDQNCVGGDASASYPSDTAAFKGPPASVPKDLRILLITIDTARADHFGMYGYDRKTSPHLDQLAGQGTVFEHGWAHAPSTRYSMPAILSGRLPLEVRYDNSVWWPALSAKALTIAETLKPLGYHTGAITNYQYFDPVRRMNQGIDEYDNSNQILHHSVTGSGPEQTKGSSSKEQTDKAIAFVDRNADKPWFLWVHYYDPHYAYEPHAGFDFGSDKIALYDGEIAFTDHHIGRLFDHLKAAGVFDKTVVVVTGDHGEGFGEHAVELHGYHLYAAQTKVPFVIRVPGLPGRRSTTPAGHIDILPTLVDLAGGKRDPEMMGSSLVDAIAGVDRDRMVFQQLSFENNNEKRAGADRQCHVIYNISPLTSWEVYRIDRDPDEAHDLSYTDDCADSRRTFERWYDHTAIPAGAAEALLPARPALATTVDAELGDSVRLLACETPATVKAGQAVEIAWTFEVRGTVEPGWKMFVHVKPRLGPFINGDHVPARPFEWWRAGQFIRYTTSVTVPRNARGTLTVHAGMFKGSERAPVKSARAPVIDNAVACSTFEVVP